MHDIQKIPGNTLVEHDARTKYVAINLIIYTVTPLIIY
jgi:hypothetical protein